MIKLMLLCQITRISQEFIKQSSLLKSVNTTWFNTTDLH